jgi:hypothetical protein
MLLLLHRSALACWVGSNLALAADGMTQDWRQAYVHWDFSSVAQDQDYVAPVARDLSHLAQDPDTKAAFDELALRLRLWSAASASSPLPHRLAACLNAAALVDMGRGVGEAEFNFHVFAVLLREHPPQALAAACVDLIEGRNGFAAQAQLPALGMLVELNADDVQARMALLARKLLGRALGRLPTTP